MLIISGRIFLCTLLSFITGFSIAQKKQKPQLVIDSAQYIKGVLDERNTSLDFFKTTATVSDVSTISFFTELNYITPRSWQKKPYVMNLLFNTPVPIGGKWFHIPHQGIYFALHIHPDVMVRILQNDKTKGDSSSPVRTPSFKPGMTLFMTWNKLWNTGEFKPKHYFGFKFSHHSNGQDGVHFTPDGYWNRYNGDFADMFIYEFIYGGLGTGELKHDRRKVTVPNHVTRTAAIYNYYWKGSFALHPKSGLPPEMGQFHLYGYYRTNLQAGFIWAPYFQDYVVRRNKKSRSPVNEPVRKEIFRVYANLDYIWDYDLNSGSIYNLKRVKLYDITKRLNASITISARVPGTPFAGLFLQGGYYGSDPYNVYFQQSSLFIRAGLSIGYFIQDTNTDKQKGRLSIGF